MKAKHALIILVAGYCLDVLGALFRIVHMPGGNNILMAATALKIVGAILFLYKLLTYPRLKEFLNR